MIKILYLSSCGLTDIKAGVFRYLPLLSTLDISDNKISVIPDGVFDGLVNLKTVVIGGTNLHSVTQEIALLPMLGTLHLRGSNNFTFKFGPNFRKSYNLENIYLEELNYAHINSSNFENLCNSNIRIFYFLHVYMQSVATGSFNLFSNISRFYVMQKSFPIEGVQNITESLSGTLSALTFNDIGISAINSSTFQTSSNFNNLVKLDLSQNELKIIGSFSFAKMGNLTQLILRNNFLTNTGLHKNVFANLTSLQLLDIGYNNLVAIPNMVDAGLSSSLESLMIHNNAIKEITPTTFNNLFSLQIINMNKNGIRRISTSAFVGLSQLRILTIETNYITSLRSKILDPLISLEELHLGQNNIVNIASDIFEYNQMLTYLSLRNNPLLGASTLSPDIFSNASSLKLLDISGSGLYSTSLNMLAKLTTLETLYLSHNHITYMDPAAFKPLTSLKSLGMAANKLTLINESVLEPLVSLEEIDLSGNPFTCICDTFWFSQWMISTDLNILDLTRRGSYSCASPASERSKDILDYMSQSNCVSRFGFYLTLYICAGVSLFGIIVAGIFRFRWYFKYYLYLIRSRRRHLLDQQDQRIYQYDAFVCYHNTTLKWVINKLLPQMEYKHGFKLCLHDRNWPVGDAIVDTIVNSIEHSRKTLLLVTNKFARSAWCREETELAFSRVVDEQRNLLLVVLMEEIEPRNLSPTLRQLLTTRTYLPWTEGGNKEKRFWEALKSSLKPHGSVN